MADTRFSRRKFLTRLLPGVAAAPLAQYGYDDPTPPPGADTPVNLTIRITVEEVKTALILAMIKEQGDLIRWLMTQIRVPGDPWAEKKPRAT
jgi:hypothetical protein